MQSISLETWFLLWPHKRCHHCSHFLSEKHMHSGIIFLENICKPYRKYEAVSRHVACRGSTAIEGSQSTSIIVLVATSPITFLLYRMKRKRKCALLGQTECQCQTEYGRIKDCWPGLRNKKVSLVSDRISILMFLFLCSF